MGEKKKNLSIYPFKNFTEVISHYYALFLPLNSESTSFCILMAAVFRHKIIY